MIRMGVVVCAVLLALGSFEPANATIIGAEALGNGDFAKGLSGWTVNNPGSLPCGIKSADTDGSGPLNASDAFYVQTAKAGVSVTQNLNLIPGGAYTLSADIVSSFSPPDGDPFGGSSLGGIITIALGGQTISTHDFGNILANDLRFTTLNASFVATAPGVLDINFFRSSQVHSPHQINYLDNVSVVLTDSPNSPSPVPEPTTMLLLATGLAMLAGFGRKKFVKK